MKKDWQKLMEEQIKDKNIFKDVVNYSFEYLDNFNEQIYPSENDLASLSIFDEKIANDGTEASEVLSILHKYGSKTCVKYNKKYFGFVNGGVIPIGLSAKWLADTWDQNSSLHVMSPIASKLEEVCENWIIELIGLSSSSGVGFVSGSSIATLCGLATARNEILMRNGYDIQEDGMFNAPKLRIVASAEVHSSVFKALNILGFGRKDVELIPVDDSGKLIVEEMPTLDSYTIVIIQAGNVNGGAFDNIDEVCNIAKEVGSWVHVDGAFGLWAATSKKYAYLTKGIEKADSMVLDAHKTLNVPYDSGMVICKDKTALMKTMSSSGSYLNFGENRDPMQYNLEMSKRARVVELWAILKYLGRAGVENLINSLCENTEYFKTKLEENQFEVCRSEFNQIVFKCSNEELTKKTLENIQNSHICWCSGSMLNEESCIRISVCSWQTTTEDIDECIKLFIMSRDL